MLLKTLIGLGLSFILSGSLQAATYVGEADPQRDEEAKTFGRSVGGEWARGFNLGSAQRETEDYLGDVSIDERRGSAGKDARFKGSVSARTRIHCQGEGSFSAVGVEGRILGCEGPSGALSAVTVRLCDAPVSGNYCGDMTDGTSRWGDPLHVKVDQTVTQGQLSATLECPDPGGCFMRLRVERDGQYNGDTLESQGQVEYDRQASMNGTTSGFNRTLGDARYVEAFRNDARSMGECRVAQQESFDSSGIVYTCDGKQNVQYDTSGTGCTTRRECVETEIRETVTQHNCFVTPDSGFRTCRVTVPEYTCEVSLDRKDYQCTRDLVLDTQSCTLTRDCTSGTCQIVSSCDTVAGWRLEGRTTESQIQPNVTQWVEHYTRNERYVDNCGSGSPVTRACGAGARYNAALDRCETSPACPSGTAWSPQANLCVSGSGQCDSALRLTDFSADPLSSTPGPVVINYQDGGNGSDFTLRRYLAYDDSGQLIDRGNSGSKCTVRHYKVPFNVEDLDRVGRFFFESLRGRGIVRIQLNGTLIAEGPETGVGGCQSGPWQVDVEPPAEDALGRRVLSSLEEGENVFEITVNGNEAFDFVLNGTAGSICGVNTACLGDTANHDMQDNLCWGSPVNSTPVAPQGDVPNNQCRILSEACLDPVKSQRMVNGVPVSRSCWSKQVAWACWPGSGSRSCEAPVKDCRYTGYTCTRSDPEAGGACMQWEERYVCEDQAETECDGVSDRYGCTNHPALLQADKNQDGYPLDAEWLFECYTSPVGTCSAAVDEFTTCKPPHSSICRVESDFGLCEEVELQNECIRQEETCVAYEDVETCSDTTRGINDDLVFKNESNFHQAVGALSTSEMIQANMDVSENGEPRIFTGERLSDKKAKDDWSKALLGWPPWYEMDCTHDDPDKIKLKEEYCTENHLRLAAGKMTGRVHTEPHWTDRRRKSITPFKKKTVELYRAYCLFDSVLARVIQEQGRQQLAELVASGAALNTKTAKANFGFWAGPGWTPPVNVNGNRVSFYRWDPQCRDASGAVTAEAQSTAICDIKPEVWAAVCSNADGECGDLPRDPRYGSTNGEWIVSNLDPERTELQAINRYTVIEGGCTMVEEEQAESGISAKLPQQCSYNLKAWIAGKGGQLRTAYPLNWPLMTNDDEWSGYLWSAGKFELEPYQYAYGDRLPSQVRMRWRPVERRNDQGQPEEVINRQVDLDTGDEVLTWGPSIWREVRLPTTGGGIVRLANTEPSADLMGGCDLKDNLCEFTVTITNQVTAKPWRGYKDADCSGFTAEQIRILDFERMDLSEYLDTLEIPENAEDEKLKAIGELAGLQIKGGEGQYSSTTERLNGKVERLMQVNPDNGYGPVEVTAYINPIWPIEEADGTRRELQASRVEIDWGDGARSVAAKMPQHGNRLGAKHTYNRVGNKDVTYKIVAKFYTSEGIKTVTGRFLLWSNKPRMDGGAAQGAGYGGESYYHPTPRADQAKALEERLQY